MATTSKPIHKQPLFGNDALAAGLLSAVAGFVDTAGFIALFGLLPAHLTAELVTTGAGVAAHSEVGFAGRVAMLPLFMLSVAGAALVARAVRKTGKAPLATLLGLMTFGLAIFCMTGVVLGPSAVRPDSWAVLWIGGSAVMAMGIQNAIMRESLFGFCPTTVMTGNLTQFSMDLVEIVRLTLRRRSCPRALDEVKARLRKSGGPLLGFMIGAVSGGWLTGMFGLVSVALPTCVVCGMAAVAFRISRARRESDLAMAPASDGRKLPAAKKRVAKQREQGRGEVGPSHSFVRLRAAAKLKQSGS